MPPLMQDGVASPTRGFQDVEASALFPSYVAEKSPLGFVDTVNPSPEYVGVAPAIGSTDLSFPRTDGGKVGTNHAIKTDGAVTGEVPHWTGLKTQSPNHLIGTKGVVKGGEDYLTQVNQTYSASLVQVLTQQASTNALLSVV